MARRKGTPNKTYFNHPGKMKDTVIKVRVSQDWLELFKAASGNAALIKNMSVSRRIRYLVMHCLLQYCHPQDIKAVQDELEKT